MKYTEVTKEEFYDAIQDKNVHPRIEGNYPYTSCFLDPYGREHGRTVDYVTDDNAGLGSSRYYLCDGA